MRRIAQKHFETKSLGGGSGALGGTRGRMLLFVCPWTTSTAIYPPAQTSIRTSLCGPVGGGLKYCIHPLLGGAFILNELVVLPLPAHASPPPCVRCLISQLEFEFPPANGGGEWLGGFHILFLHKGLQVFPTYTFATAVTNSRCSPPP